MISLLRQSSLATALSKTTACRCPSSLTSPILEFSTIPPQPSPVIDEPSPKELSNNQLFKRTEIDNKIYSHIKSLGIGIPSNNRSNNAKNRGKKHNTFTKPPPNGFSPVQPPPPPFCPNSRKGVTVIAKVGIVLAEDQEDDPVSPSSSSIASKISDLNAKALDLSSPPDDLIDAPFFKKKLRKSRAQVFSSALPPPNPMSPEVAMIGRSNVGKSTLVNALLYGNLDVSTSTALDDPHTPSINPRAPAHAKNKTPSRYKLPKGTKAIISDRPGETRELTFYRLSTNDAKRGGVTVVDMPGYGFAYGRNGTDGGYEDLILKYITESREEKAGVSGGGLKRLLLLVDGRHGLKMADKEFLKSLEKRVYESNRASKMLEKKARSEIHRVAEQGLSLEEEEVAAFMKKTGKEGGGGGGSKKGAGVEKAKALIMPPIQIVITKADLVKQVDLAKRVELVKASLKECLKREYGNLPVMLVSALPGVGFNNVRNGAAKGGVLQLQQEIAGLAFKGSKTSQKT